MKLYAKDPNRIDPIGESDIEKPIEQKDIEHELICNTGTAIENAFREVGLLDSIIKDYEIYTNNTFILNKLKNLRNRLSDNLNDINKNFNRYADLHS